MLEGIATGAIRFYQQYLSDRKCPHGQLSEEHCSDYGIRAITEEGLVKGGLKTVARIASCFRKDADAYVEQGRTAVEYAKLAVDAKRFHRLASVRGGVIAVEMSAIDNFFFKENWTKKAKYNAGFCDVCDGSGGDF
jgi:putative component of membrane protein insertase Oxa1/YidC/SpoIIIJ protein YidD